MLAFVIGDGQVAGFVGHPPQTQPPREQRQRLIERAEGSRWRCFCRPMFLLSGLVGGGGQAGSGWGSKSLRLALSPAIEAGKKQATNSGSWIGTKPAVARQEEFATLREAPFRSPGSSSCTALLCL